MKLRTLSAIACGAVLGLGLLSGCGSSGSGGSGGGAVPIAGAAIKGPLFGANIRAIFSDGSESNATTDANGTYSLANRGLAYSLRARGGTFGSIPFSGELIAPHGSSVISPITTMYTDANGTELPQVKAVIAKFMNLDVRDLGTLNYTTPTFLNPDDNATKLINLKVLELAKVFGEAVILPNANVLPVFQAELADLNASEDLNGTRFNSVVLKVKTDANTTLLSDVNTTITNATQLTPELDVNLTTVVNAIETGLESFENAHGKLVLKFLNDYVTLGDTNVTVNASGSFSAGYNALTSTQSITDLLGVSFDVNTSALKDRNVSDITLAIEIANTDRRNGEKVALVINGIEANATAAGSLALRLPVGKTVTATSTGLASLPTSLSLSTLSPVNLTTSGNTISFDIAAILNQFSGSYNYADRLAALTSYAKQAGTYTVKIGLSNNIATDYPSNVVINGTTYQGLTGTIKVGANTTPTLSIPATYSVVADSNVTLSATGADADGDTLTYTWDSNSSDHHIRYALASATGSSVTLTPMAAGISDINVTVSDGRGGSVTRTTRLTVTEAPAAFALSATDFNNKKIVATAEGDTVTLNLYADGNFTESSVEDGNSTGTWSVSADKLTLTYPSSGYVQFTFPSAPAANLVVSAYDYVSSTDNNTFNVTISSIGTADARTSVNTGSCEVEDMFGNTAPGTYVNGVCVAN